MSFGRLNAPNNQDGDDAGAIDYVYAQMAKNAGLSMTDTHLFPAQHGAGGILPHDGLTGMVSDDFIAIQTVLPLLVLRVQ